jgi:hypothetical protein
MKTAMLSRRSLLAGSAALAAGCSSLSSPLSPPSLPKVTELNWAVIGEFPSLHDPEGLLNSNESILQGGLTALAEDRENPYGPAHGRFSIRLHYAKHWPQADPQPKDLEEWLAYYVEVLDAYSADLVTVSPFLMDFLSEHGLIVPLDRFLGKEKASIEDEFFSSALESQHRSGAHYSLPMAALPQMVTYDARFFEKRGVPPVDSSWDWDGLVHHAQRLTLRHEDGDVARWGVVTLGILIDGIWWALWQNEAKVVDPESLQCRLQETASLEALQFFRDLIHTHQVSPPVDRDGLYSLWLGVTPLFAMQYITPALSPTTLDFQLAELPRGRERAVPVGVDLGIAIAARTEKAEAAYTALRGVVGAMQRFVHVPAERETLSRLGEIRTRLRSEEVAAIQRSMEHGIRMPRFSVEHLAMDRIVWGLVRGDDVATVANSVCTFMDEEREFCLEMPNHPRCNSLWIHQMETTTPTIP